jgi:hypothetical protein
MRVGCLGWGSLIWDPRELDIAGRDSWHSDGPLLPVEFARQSSRDRLTLVLMPHGRPVRVQWAEMTDERLGQARANLARREGSDAIGEWPSTHQHEHSHTIAEWAKAKGLDAVVWTALEPKFNGVPGRIPSGQDVLAYLSGLVAAGKSHAAEEYVRRAPRQIRTPFREIIEAALGWTAESD